MSRKRKKGKVHPATRLAALLAIIFVVSAIGFQVFLSSASKPVDSAATDTINVEIPSGSSTDSIAGILEENGLIRSTFAFGIKSRLEGLDGTYEAGYYALAKNMTMDEIMQAIQKGTALTVRFTIPEGFDIKKTAERLSEKGLINIDEFMNQVETGDYPYKFLADAASGRERLEGFLYPDTYEVYPDADERQIIDKMLARFDALFTDEYYDRAAEMGMSVNQVITLASIIEREARVPEDRPVIASVFYNRLEIGMPLQSCATVQFILGEQKEKLTNDDIAIDSPYNTYKNKGLPPGPICSPGIDSIKAALYPADTDYLYFLAKGDGSHVFSVTYDDFLKNKDKYIN